MPQQGKRWYHIIINTRGSWLHGDPRGFRSRNHRKHSDGDYKNPPPAGQHAGLHKHIRGNSRPPVRLPVALFGIVGGAILAKASSQGYTILAIAIDAHHVHLLAELPADRKQVKQIVGSWKQRASHKVRRELPGDIWSKSCDPKVIEDRTHQLRVYDYILKHRGAGAWVWSIKDEASDHD